MPGSAPPTGHRSPRGSGRWSAALVALALLGGSLAAISAGLPGLPGLPAAAAATPAAATPATIPAQTILGFRGLKEVDWVAVDRAGDVFVTDDLDGDVVELPTTGPQVVLGFTGLSTPAGVAVNSAGDVFVVDRYRNLVVELRQGGGQRILPLGGLDRPTGVALDGAGDVFVADSGNHRVVELTTGGTQITLPFAGLEQPTGVAVDGSGDVFVTDRGDARVVELSKAGIQTTLPFRGIDADNGIAVDRGGDVFVTGPGVYELPLDGVPVALGFSVEGPVGVALDGNGDVIVTDFSADQVVELPPATVPRTSTALGFSKLYSPGGVAVDSSGDVFAAQSDGDVTQTAQAVDELPLGGPQVKLPFSFAALSEPGAVAVDRLGDVFVADDYYGTVLELPNGGTQTTVLSLPDQDYPGGIAVDQAGDLFVTNYEDNTVVEVPKGGSPTSLGFTGLSGPAGVGVDARGDVFVSDSNDNRVVKLPEGGSQVTLGFTGLTTPYGLAVDAQGDVFVANRGTAQQVFELPVDGSQVLLPPAAPDVAWVAVDGVGNVYESDAGLRTVDELATPPSVAVTVAGSQPFGGKATFSQVDNAPASVAVTGSVSCGTVDNGVAIGPTLTPGAAPYSIDGSSCSGLSLSGPGASNYTISYRGAAFNVGQAAIAWATPAPIVYGTPLEAAQLNAIATVPGTFAYTPAPGTVLHAGYQQPLTVTFTPTDTADDAPATETVSVDVAKASLTVTANNVTWPYAQPEPVLTAAYTGFVNGDRPSALHGSLQLVTPATEANPGDYAITASGLVSSDYNITFVNGMLTVAANEATFLYPGDHAEEVSSTQPFTWLPYPGAQAYYLLVGTAQYGGDLVNSGPLPPTQSSYEVPDLPATGRYLYATLFTEVDGSWSRFQAIEFVPAPGHATFTYPVNGQADVTVATPFSWATVTGAQGYDLIVGTTLYGSNLVNSGVLSASQASFTVPALPTGKVLYATLFTEVEGAWSRYQVVGFIAAS